MPVTHPLSWIAWPGVDSVGGKAEGNKPEMRELENKRLEISERIVPSSIVRAVGGGSCSGTTPARRRREGSQF